MKSLIFSFVFLSLVAAADTLPVVTIETNMGSIDIELNSDKAPISVGNFLGYVDSGFYADTIFHRVVKNFVIQGGGLTKEMIEKPTKDPIKNEAGNGLSNLKGTIGMARTEVVDSATAQFYINTKDNLGLDHKDETQEKFGYAVFGKVINGYDIVEKIENLSVHNDGDYDDIPDQTVTIISVKRKEIPASFICEFR